MTIRVLQIGLGPIGVAVARQIVGRDGFELVGGVDPDPQKVGRDLGEIMGLDRALSMPVQDALEGALESLRPDVAVVCTSSSLERTAPTFETCLAAGVAVVSTTEELSYPWFHQPELARRLDQAARDGGRALLGTGVNPGFAMDALPLTLTAVCERVDGVTVRRVQDAARRRLPFQKKIGAGLTVEAFEQGVAAGRIRHVGLPESIAMIGAGLGWELDDIAETIEPVVAEERVASAELAVEAGQVCGLRQLGFGREGERVRVRMEFEARLGVTASFDEVEIQGSPSLRSRIDAGIPGDVATASVVVNAIPRVLAAPAGLITMKDLPPAVSIART
ncbi:MAG: NAD(P)H-dependent amine dehydrogenase family protein [Thermoanaerobaculia bacterium]